MITAGIDCGSQNTKGAIVKDGKVLSTYMLPTEFDADLVAMGAPLRGPRTGPGLSPLRSTQHRVLDALDIPVLIVPMPGVSGTDE